MKDDVTLVDAARRSPVRLGLFAALPVVLGGLQLANGALTALSPAVAAAFAAAMCCYAAVYTRFHLARERLAALEGEVAPATAD